MAEENKTVEQDEKEALDFDEKKKQADEAFKIRLAEMDAKQAAMGFYPVYPR